MNREHLIKELRVEIKSLQTALDALTGTTTSHSPSKAAGKPPKRKNKLSAKGRKAISDAAKKRWAEKKRAAKG